MPLYEYKCQDCGAEFEALVSFSARDDVACEQCGSVNVERLVSDFASSSESGGGYPACAPSG